MSVYMVLMVFKEDGDRIATRDSVLAYIEGVMEMAVREENNIRDQQLQASANSAIPESCNTMLPST